MGKNCFEKIYESANIASKKNLETYQDKIELDIIEEELPTEEKIRKNSNDAIWQVNDVVTKADVHSEELFNIIYDLRFEILEYGKRIDDINYYEEYDPIIEYYTVKFNNYKFVVKNMYDVDIPDGIFGVHKIENIITNEDINYYVDLGCKNTGKERLNDFMLLLTCNTKDEFLTKKYSLYKNLSNVLKNNGISILEDTLEFDMQHIKGYIKVDERVFVIPYIAWHDEVRIVVTNCNRWNVNSSNYGYELGYYIDNYKDEKDINIIIDNIKEFKRHLRKEFGFYENDRYYNNKDISEFLDVKKNKKGEYLDCFNHRLIEIDQVRDWDGRGYGNPYINLYNGLEIASHFKVTFNDACQWSIGDIINHSDIIIKYDKKIDKDNCILLIRNYQYTNDDNFYNDYFDEDNKETIIDFENNIKDEYLVDEIEFVGSFVSVMKMLTQYLNTMCKIFNIEEVFKFN